MQKKMVVVQGFGGVGKTAFVCEAADWLTRTGMYKRAYYTSFERDGVTAMKTLKDVSEEVELDIKHILVVVDSLESILPGGEYPLEVSDRTELWNMLSNLAHKGAGVLLTSSDTTVGDGRLEEGKKVKHLLLEGLGEGDAYVLAMHLLKLKGLTGHMGASYAELKDLLAYLGNHPLAIELVLPRLSEKSSAEIKRDLASLLQKCIDNNKTGRHHSLIDLLGGPLRRLSDLERAMLHRLALFEGGASKKCLLGIADISEDEWDALQKPLEGAGLLVRKLTHNNSDVPFFHFHPALAPYLRQPGRSDKALCERYVKCYYVLAKDLYREDKRDLPDVQALVRLELPNLKHALEMLLDAGKQDEVSEMVESMCWFLKKFKRMWEQNMLQQQVKAVAGAKDLFP